MSSRYDPSLPLTYTSPNGVTVNYLAPRVLPQGDTVAGTGTRTVTGAELGRLDLVANRTLNDPEQAWRIADANDAMDPFELVTRPSQQLKLPT